MYHGRGVSQDFIRKLRRFDADLRACFDPSQDAILVWSERAGRPKTHEFTSRRCFEAPSDSGVLGPDNKPVLKLVELHMGDLEAWTLKRLDEIDTWKRFGSGLAFDDWLAQQEEAFRAGEKRRFDHDRGEYLKEHRHEFAEALENVKRGYVAPNQKKPLTRKQVRNILGEKPGTEKRIVVPV